MKPVYGRADRRPGRNPHRAAGKSSSDQERGLERLIPELNTLFHEGLGRLRPRPWRHRAGAGRFWLGGGIWSLWLLAAVHGADWG